MRLMDAVSASATTVDHLNPLPVGSRLQEFIVEGVIGMGGFGIVYQANDTLLHRTVAIKEYMPAALASRGDANTVSVHSASYAQDFDTGKATFIDEARMLARFKHPALIEVFRFWEQNQTAYMATPFYQGRTLKEHLRALPDLPDETALKLILLPVLDALEHMHREQVYHRDISPDNILVLEDGTPILLDLGAARRIEADHAQTFTVLVKPGYAPIEQYAGDASNLQGPWTDIYGWGASAYFSLIGKPPPPAASRVMNDSATRLVDIRPHGFSHDFLAAIDAALAVRPDDRPQNVAALKVLLALKTHAQPGPTTAFEVTEELPNRRPTTRSTAPLTDALPGIAATATATAAATATAQPEAERSSKPIVVGMLVLLGLIAALGWYSQRPASSDLPIAAGNPSQNSVQVPQRSEKLGAERPAAPQSGVTSKAGSGDAQAARGDMQAARGDAQATPADVAVLDKLATARFAIKPWGEVHINGERRGVSPPIKALSLPAGEYSVEIRNGEFPAYRTKIKLKPGQVFSINHAFVDAAAK